MKGDFSRRTFKPEKHYSGVLMQQGRVQLDADWNEQLAIREYRETVETVDVVGATGAPKYDAGFGVQISPDGKDLLLTPGRIYVQGALCERGNPGLLAVYQNKQRIKVIDWGASREFSTGRYVRLSADGISPIVTRITSIDQANDFVNVADDISAFSAAAQIGVEALASYLMQPDLPFPDYASYPANAAPILNLPAGTYIPYLDVWQRFITAFDDEEIREKALNGPDTAGRSQTVWQFKLWPGPNGGANPLDGNTQCGSDVPGWDDLVAGSDGTLAARTKPQQDPGNPCIIPPSAGYMGLENQLYRVEIQSGGILGADSPTFKWSRENGSVLRPLQVNPDGSVTMPDTGPDDVLGFANGQWVEFVDDGTVLMDQSPDLFQFQIDPVTQVVTLPASITVNANLNPMLRRWDSAGALALPANGAWVDLESGIQVQFGAAGKFSPGDYWTIPARNVLGDIEWPKDINQQPLPQKAFGIHHDYCRLGVLTWGGAQPGVEDCRPIFPPLNELKPSPRCCVYTVADGKKQTGDYTKIQDAIDALPAAGGEICIMPGTYIENVVIKGKSHVSLQGCGEDCIIQSAAAAANAVASPVLTISNSQHICVKGLALLADPTGAGILVDSDEGNFHLGIISGISNTPPQDEPGDYGDFSTRRIDLVDLYINAAQDSAIKVIGAERLRIEDNTVDMGLANGAWPGLFVYAEDALVKGNWIKSIDPNQDLPGMEGATGVSGIQLAGGSSLLRVEDNLIESMSGQGITLGALMQVQGADGNPALQGWVVDGNDPCLDCGKPTTGIGGTPGGGQGPTYKSTGFLYQVEIRCNRISGNGMDGIGVVAFPSLLNAAGKGIHINVFGLEIIGNQIIECLQRQLGDIPAESADSMGYGGIALAFCLSAYIADNAIQYNGRNSRQPVCGIFILFAEGLEIHRNRISGNGRGDRVSLAGANASPLFGRRGGIQIVFASPLSSAGGYGWFGHETFSESSNAQGSAAVVVQGNTVETPLGQALSIAATGRVCVQGNRLASSGLAPLHFSALLPLSNINLLAYFSSLVSIVDLGASSYSSSGMTGFSSYHTTSYYGASDANYANYRIDANPGTAAWLLSSILFQDNVCSLKGKGGTRAESFGSVGFPPAVLPATLIIAMMDVGFQNNQCDSFMDGGIMPFGQILLSLMSLRVQGNRFDEGDPHAATPIYAGAVYSLLSFSLINNVSNNQSNHCMENVGVLLIKSPNQVFLDMLAGKDNGFCGVYGTYLGEVALLLFLELLLS